MRTGLAFGSPEENDLYQRAEGDRRSGSHTEAYRTFERLLEMRLSGDCFGTAADRVLVERVADLAVLFGEDDAAEGYLGVLEGLYRDGGLSLGSDYAALKLLHFRLQTERRVSFPRDFESLSARFPGMETLEDRPPELWEAGLPAESKADFGLVVLGQFYLVLGSWFLCEGEYPPALRLLSRGVECVENRTETLARSVLSVLRSLEARALMESGDLTGARDRLRANPPGEETLPADRIAWRETLSRLDFLQGRYGDARKGLDAVVEFARNGGFPRGEIAARLNRAGILVLLNRTADAERDLDEVSGLQARFRDVGPVLRVQWCYRAVAARRRGSARSRIASVLEMQSGAAIPESEIPEAASADDNDDAVVPVGSPEQSPDFLSFFEDRLLESEWNLAESRFRRARLLLNLCRDTFSGVDSELVRVRMDLLDGTLMWYEGRIVECLAALRAVRPRLEALDLLPDLWQLLRVLGWVHRVRPDLPGLPGLRESERDVRARLEASFDDPAERAVWRINKWRETEEDLWEDLRGLEEVQCRAEECSWPRRWLRRRRLSRQLGDLYLRTEELRRAAFPMPEWSPPVALEDLRPPRRAVVLRYFLFPDQIRVLVSDRRRTRQRVFPVSRLVVREKVAAWHGLCRQLAEDPTSPGAGALSASLKRLADELGEILGLSAVLAELSMAPKYLLIAADDVLNGLPFAAVRVGGRYLVEDYIVGMVAPAQADSSPSVRPDRGLVVVASGGAEETADFPEIDPLEGARREGELLRGLFPQATILDRAEADVRHLSRELPQARWVHFAGHGFFSVEDLDRIGLVLTPDRRTVEIFSIRTVLELDGRGVEHVTLSGCWLADNYVLPGREVVSVPLALLSRGVGSVLASLWALDDEAGTAWMEAWYRRMLGTRTPRLDAVAAVQRDFLSGRMAISGIDTREPIYWAGLQLYGRLDRLGPGRSILQK